MAISVGDTFPRAPLDLSDRWAGGPLIVAFHRLWCPFCQQAQLELEAEGDRIRAAGGDVVFVFRQGADAVEAACAERGGRFSCLADHEQGLERAAGIERFTLSRYLTTALPRRMREARKAGAKTLVPRSDILQGRGTYVVGSDGKVVYAHVSQNAADTPPTADLVAAVLAQSSAAV